MSEKKQERKEHIAELKAGAFIGPNQLAQSISKLVEALADDSDGFRGSIEELSVHLANLSETVASHSELIASAEKERQDDKKTLLAVVSASASLAQAMEEARGRISKALEGFVSLSERLDALMQHVEVERESRVEIAHWLSELQRKDAGNRALGEILEGRIANHAEVIAEFAARLSSLSSSNAQMADKIGRVEEAIASLTAVVQGLRNA